MNYEAMIECEGLAGVIEGPTLTDLLAEYEWNAFQRLAFVHGIMELSEQILKAHEDELPILKARLKRGRAALLDRIEQDLFLFNRIVHHSEFGTIGLPASVDPEIDAERREGQAILLRLWMKWRRADEDGKASVLPCIEGVQEELINLAFHESEAVGKFSVRGSPER